MDFATQEIVTISGPNTPPWYEWLVRPRGVHTDELIGAIQSLDWMVDFDLSVVDHACKWLSLQNHNGVDCRLSVNVFADSISTPNFAKRIVKLINAASIDPEQICFEIIEHTPVSDLGSATNFCRAVRKLGAKVALDDIGSGHVHVGLLAPETLIDFMKIDRSAVFAARHSERKFKAVQSVVDFARSVNVPVVLEGIETEEDLLLTERFGARYYQGYLQGRPQLVDWGVNEDRSQVAFALRELTA